MFLNMWTASELAQLSDKQTQRGNVATKLYFFNRVKRKQSKTKHCREVGSKQCARVHGCVCECRKQANRTKRHVSCRIQPENEKQRERGGERMGGLCRWVIHVAPPSRRHTHIHTRLCKGEREN